MKEFDPHSLEPFWDAWYIENLIGEGSFGSVYKIYREEFGTRYYSALKIISIPKSSAEEKELIYEGMDDKSAVQYFKDIVEVVYKEISIMSELKGKTNIVSYEDHKIIKKDNGIGFYILIRMELLESLNDYLLRIKLTNEDIVRIGKDLCKALILCNRRNLIHRDIKPANIFVSADGDFKLGDFGIARQLEGAQEGLSIKGTYNYMAPEVYLGYAYDERVDIYSLGMVLYYYLNNKKGPFLNTNTTVQKYSERQEGLKRRFSGEMLPKPVLASERLSEIILKACAFDANQRYSKAEEFLADLEKLEVADLNQAVCIPDQSKEAEVSLEDETSSLNEGTVLLNQSMDNSDDDERTVMLNPSTNIGEDFDEEKTEILVNGNKADEKEAEEVVPNRTANKKRLLLLGTAFIALALLLIFGSILILNKNRTKDTKDVEETVLTVTAAPTITPQPLISITPTVAVENSVINRDSKKLTDLSSIENIEQLTILSVAHNKLESIDELKASTQLQQLKIQDNKISDISVIDNMKQLILLNAMDNQITDISCLKNLVSLETLILSKNNIKDISALENLNALTELRLADNKEIVNIDVLSKLDHLQVLILSNTKVTDISPLYGLKELQLLDLTNLNISKKQISTIKKELPDCDVIY